MKKVDQVSSNLLTRLRLLCILNNNCIFACITTTTSNADA